MGVRKRMLGENHRTIGLKKTVVIGK